MINKDKENRQALEIICLETLIPKEHLLRKIDAAVQFEHIYDLVEDLYCPDNGRPSIDPVVLFKMVLIQHIYGIRSLRQTSAEVEMNIAYRWFIGYPINKPTPHFATISYNFLHRFKEETVEKIFEWILDEVENAGYLAPEVVFVDGTHIKANANIKKKVKEAIPVAAKIYEKQLREEVNKDREEHDKKPFDDNPPNQPPEEKIVTKSTTDPDCGVFHKGEHKKCFAYCAQTMCDSHNFILGVTVNPGNMHDSVAFDAVYDKVTARYPQIKVVTADAAYKTPWICKKIFDDGRIPSLPYKRPMTKKGNLEWYKYVYDEYYDCVICPEYQILKYTTTNKDGYREYKSDPDICRNCPSRALCTASKSCQKTVTIHVWKDYIELAEDIRHSPLGKETYEQRKETIERVFADAKEKYEMRYTPHRGLAHVSNWVKLKYAAMNLKKLAVWSWRDTMPPISPLLEQVFNMLFIKMLIKNPVFGC
jgi:transposase